MNKGKLNNGTLSYIVWWDLYIYLYLDVFSNHLHPLKGNFHFMYTVFSNPEPPENVWTGDA